MDHTLFNGFPELLNADYRPLCFKFDQRDGQLHLETYVFIQTDTINLYLQLIRNAVHISDTACGGFSCSIG